MHSQDIRRNEGLSQICQFIKIIDTIKKRKKKSFKLFLKSCIPTLKIKPFPYRGRMEPIVLVHGGAGDIPDSRIAMKTIGVKTSAKIGYDVLKKGGTVLDAVEAAVRFMEGDEAFNAGMSLRFTL